MAENFSTQNSVLGTFYILFSKFEKPSNLAFFDTHAVFGDTFFQALFYSNFILWNQSHDTAQKQFFCKPEADKLYFPFSGSNHQVVPPYYLSRNIKKLFFWLIRSEIDKCQGHYKEMSSILVDQ
jgi:hypothetical protein